MDKILSFFRVFDIAFVVPGAVLFVSLYSRCQECANQLDSSFSSKDVIFILITIGVTYILGLFVHTVQRILSKKKIFAWLAEFALKSDPSDDDKEPWYKGLDRKSQEDLALYFWYLRATYRNLAVAIPLGAIIFIIPDSLINWPSWMLIPCAFIVSWILCFSGYEYNDSYKKASSLLE